MKKVLLAVAGAAAAGAALSAARRQPPAGGVAGTRISQAAALSRTNFRGRSVSLAGGPALAAAASVTAAAGAGSVPAAAAALVAGLGAGAVGRYDDEVGGRPAQQAKGFRGHLAALREGRVTSGLIKIAGVGVAGLAASALLAAGEPAHRRTAASALLAVGEPAHRRTAASALLAVGEPAHRRTAASALLAASAPAHRRTAIDILLGAGVIAGTANLINLLDLRPGRALKAGLLLGAPLTAGRTGGLVAGPVGAAAALLPADLDEQVMLGDCGANALGALLGVGLAARTGRWGRAGLLAGLAALTAASEKVSFTSVIESTPGLRELDALGRRPRRG